MLCLACARVWKQVRFTHLPLSVPKKDKEGMGAPRIADWQEEQRKRRREGRTDEV